MFSAVYLVSTKRDFIIFSERKKGLLSLSVFIPYLLFVPSPDYFSLCQCRVYNLFSVQYFFILSSRLISSLFFGKHCCYYTFVHHTRSLKSKNKTSASVRTCVCVHVCVRKYVNLVDYPRTSHF